ncbi:hypothetical protein K8942_04825 [Candidatus Peribacteria bacterium]|nr:MAG: hypothetical protein K8942_04825 [Candidatus Peribacteria bacterium]
MSTEALPSAETNPEAVVLPEPVNVVLQVTDAITKYHKKIANSFPRSRQGGWGEGSRVLPLS